MIKAILLNLLQKIIKRHETDLLKALNGKYEEYEEGTYELPYEYEKLD